MQMLMSHQIARVVHDANRSYCQAIGDYSQKSWEQAEEWQRVSAIKGVEAVLDGSAQTAEEQHQLWCHEKKRTGWTYGAVKDPDNKKHPCLVPYAELPPEQRRKDHLFRAIVLALVADTAVPTRLNTNEIGSPTGEARA